MNPAELFREALKRLNRENSDLPPIIIGGVAMILHGSDRLTKDIDVAFMDEHSMIATLYEIGFRAVSRAKRDERGRLAEVHLFPNAEIAFRECIGRRALIFIHEGSQARFDVWFSCPVPYRRLQERSVKSDFEGVPVRIASIEDLIELKEISLADNPARTSDRADLEFLKGLMKEKARKVTDG